MFGGFSRNRHYIAENCWVGVKEQSLSLPKGCSLANTRNLQTLLGIPRHLVNNATIQKLAILILFLIIILLCYTYLGIAKARDNSPLLVFTDADAKDADRLQEVIDAAIAKNISVTSLLTNQCSRRKRSDPGMLLIFY